MRKEKVERFDTDFSFIFGVNLILDTFINKLLKDRINLRLVLSFRCNGGANLFWLFYFSKPQFRSKIFKHAANSDNAGEIIR